MNSNNRFCFACRPKKFVLSWHPLIVWVGLAVCVMLYQVVWFDSDVYIIYQSTSITEGSGDETSIANNHTEKITEDDDDDDERRLAIFYNVYIRPEEPNNGLRIVKEQLRDRAQQKPLRDATVYYTKIGSTNATFPPCESCVELASLETGNEVVTLQKLYEYCMDSEKKNLSKRVIYIHNKGTSFHCRVYRGFRRF